MILCRHVGTFGYFDQIEVLIVEILCERKKFVPLNKNRLFLAVFLCVEALIIPF
jgi:hypothetical protein